MKKLWPALLVLFVSLAYVGWRLTLYGGDPSAIAEIGTRFAENNLQGTQGYDGQFSLFIALDPDPQSVASHLDVPAYRYQRILYPLLARLIAFGNNNLIPWTLILVNVLTHATATYLLADLLERKGYASWYALIYGLWVGLISGVGLDLHEPLAFGLVILGFYLRQRRKYVLMAVSFSLALFAKEVTVVFWLAILIADLAERKIDTSHGVLIGGGLLFGLWQFWLWRTFGMPGLGSGGDMATPFEWIPFMGFFRIGLVDLRALALFSLIFGLTILFPTIYALIQGVSALRFEFTNEYAWSSVLNAVVIVTLPFSTFREPLGLVRIFTGVVLSFTLLNAESGKRRNLNYSFFWIAMLALLVSQ
jgi:Gpi18-like mannosyltransferase